MSKTTNGLSKRQNREVDYFLDLFSDVEAALKKKLHRRVNDPTSVKKLIEEYERANKYWGNSANKLRNLKDIRNLLTHQRNSTFGFPIAVAPSSINALIELKAQLLKPEKVSMNYRKTVKMVCTDDSLVHVLILAFDNGFSQFPVISHGRFGGLITENEITRWLGRQVKASSTSIDLATVLVRRVLKEKGSSLKGIPIFQFRSLDTSVEEVMSQFLLDPTLEAILLTDSGDKHTAIEGIITQWDAARYAENGRQGTGDLIRSNKKFSTTSNQHSTNSG